jgi:Flp pilus assembly protein TadG
MAARRHTFGRLTARSSPGVRRRRRPPRWRANAILEMALLLPLLLFFAMGMVEYGQYCAMKFAFEAASRDAARFGCRAVAATADPANAATTTLAASKVTFSSSWMQIYDETTATTITDVATVPAGHPLKFYIGTTINLVPAAVRPLHAITGLGIGDGKVLWGECTMVKE